jgi:hypothetical protein
MEFRPYTRHRSIQAIVINQQMLARQLLGRTCQALMKIKIKRKYQNLQ